MAPRIRPVDVADRRWARFMRLFLVVAAIELAVVFAALVALDPYDSGRFPSLLPPGINDEAPRTADVSRGRDQHFTAAIIGNSHVQLIDPHRLAALTGIPFVQLSMPGSGPREQATVLGWFAAAHEEPRAVVVGVDTLLCTRDPTYPIVYPFPGWLYGSDMAYLRHLPNTAAITRAQRRVLVALGRKPPSDPAGYINYEKWTAWQKAPPATDRPPVDLSPAMRASPDFPGVAHLLDALAALPATTSVLLVAPPRHVSELPEPGSADYDDIRTCKEVVRRQAAAHPNWRFIDFMLDDADTRDPRNFLDGSHYRAPLARKIETAIAAALRPAAATAQ